MAKQRLNGPTERPNGRARGNVSSPPFAALTLHEWILQFSCMHRLTRRHGCRSFPFPTPLQLLGFPFGAQLRELRPMGSTDAPEWGSEIEYEILGPLRFRAVGSFGETAFFHKATSTLLVTDTIVEVQGTPPPIIQEDPRALLFHARDDVGEEIADTREARKRGWRRIVLFGLIFLPSGIDVTVASCLSDLQRRPESMRSLSGDVPLGLYPWRWARDEGASFAALQGGLLCAPILQALANLWPITPIAHAPLSRYEFHKARVSCRNSF